TLERSQRSHSEPTRVTPLRSAFAEKSWLKVAPVPSVGAVPTFRIRFHSAEPPASSVSIVGAFGIDPTLWVWFGPIASQMIELRIDEDAAQSRLDKFLRRHLSGVPASHLFKMIRTKKVRVNGSRAQPDQLLQLGDILTIRGDPKDLLAPRPAQRAPAPPPPLDPSKLVVLYED